MEDRQMIELYLKKNERAVFETNEAYGQRLFRLSMKILGSIEDAEECVNDTYLKAWETIPPTIPEYLYGYLASICRNLSLNRLRFSKAVKRRAQVVELTKEMEACIPAPQDESVDSNQLGSILTEFLKSQKKQARIIFVRRYFFGDDISAISERLGMKEAAVRKSLERTRNKLKKYLRQEGIGI